MAEPRFPTLAALYQGESVAPLCFSWCDCIHTLEGKIILSFLKNLNKIQVQPEKLKFLEGLFICKNMLKVDFLWIMHACTFPRKLTECLEKR